MSTNLIISLRIAVSALAWVICFAPANANAYTSNGSDGQFQPAVSMTLDATQQIFNFTSIFIPGDVTVSFSKPASARPIELLATKNIDIAGKLDAGANDLWIETPGSISLSGSLYSSGSALSLAANSINVTGIMNTLGGHITLTNESGILAGGTDISVGGYGGGILEAFGFVGKNGGVLTVGSCCSIPPPVPEPDVWVMLLLGFCVVFAVSRLRHQNIRLA